MNIKIFSRLNAERPDVVEANCQEPYVWISIGHPGDIGKKEPQPVQNQFCQGVLPLFFHDVEVEDDGYTSFSDDHAEQIVDFVEKHKDDVSLICVHCEAGVSRSAGAALAIGLWLNEDDMGIGPQNGYFPNILVKSKIARALRKRT